MAPPHFAMFWADQVPRATPAPGVTVTVVAGALGPTVPPAPPPHSYASRPQSGVAIWIVRLVAGAGWRAGGRGPRAADEAPHSRAVRLQ